MRRLYRFSEVCIVDWPLLTKLAKNGSFVNNSMGILQTKLGKMLKFGLYRQKVKQTKLDKILEFGLYC